MKSEWSPITAGMALHNFKFLFLYDNHKYGFFKEIKKKYIFVANIIINFILISIESRKESREKCANRIFIV